MHLEIWQVILTIAYLCVGGVILLKMEVLQGAMEFGDGIIVGSLLLVMCCALWPLFLVLNYFAVAPEWFGPPRSREATVKDDLEAPPPVGTEGVAKSDLKPWGKATFGTRVCEVHTDGFIKAGTAVVVERLKRKTVEVSAVQPSSTTGNGVAPGGGVPPPERT